MSGVLPQPQQRGMAWRGQARATVCLARPWRRSAGPGPSGGLTGPGPRRRSVALLLGERGAGLLPVRAELDDALVRERVVDHLLEDLERHRRDVGARQCSLRHVLGMADRGG